MDEKGPDTVDKIYTEADMLDAFYHGREYKPMKCDYDYLTDGTPTKHLPFWEWLYRKKDTP